MLDQQNPLEITNQSLLKNLREATITQESKQKPKDSDTPQFDF